MKKCIYCAEEIAADVVKCTHCGKEQSTSKGRKAETGFFSFKGRLNRAKYFWTMLVIGVVAISVITIWPSTVTATTVLAPCAAFFPGVKRLQDINMSGGWWVLMLVPGANLILGIVMLFKKGTVGTNQYGDDPLSK